jgi:hypothetical protein
MFSPIRILTVTVTACGCLFLAAPVNAGDRPAHASGPSRKEVAQPVRKQQHARPHSEAEERMPSREAPPRAKPGAEKPSTPQGKPADMESTPDENEEVSPGDSPASCDGCELAGITLGGSLWGLFGVRRRRGEAVIRGLQPR